MIPVKMLMGLNLQESRYMKGIWVTETQAARKPTFSHLYAYSELPLVRIVLLHSMVRMTIQ